MGTSINWAHVGQQPTALSFMDSGNTKLVSIEGVNCLGVGRLILVTTLCMSSSSVSLAWRFANVPRGI